MDTSPRLTSIPASCFAILVALACAEIALCDTVGFDHAEVGTAPVDFEYWRTGQGGAGKWMVVSDSSAIGGRALEQVSNEKTDYRFPLAIYKPVTAENLNILVRFKSVSGMVDQAGGIAVRLLTPDDYYVVRANALENNVRFYKVIKGQREQLASADIIVPSNVWNELALKAEGEKFSISFNGKPLFTASDNALTKPGKIALWTKADSVTRFDKLDIEILK